ncbi:hypothetical protein THAOC_30484, partial [Thalassiosira oceanica]
MRRRRSDRQIRKGDALDRGAGALTPRPDAVSGRGRTIPRARMCTTAGQGGVAPGHQVAVEDVVDSSPVAGSSGSPRDSPPRTILPPPLPGADAERRPPLDPPRNRPSVPAAAVRARRRCS